MTSFLVHIVAAWFAFLLPAFATFKSVSHRPVSEPELERWAKYWCVIGIIVAFEYLGEFLINWLPFYDEIKILFLLFLALPQTQGSTYVFDTFLSPWLSQHEAALDADILAIQRNVLSFAQARLGRVWELISAAVNKNAATGQQAAGAPGQSPAPGINLQQALGLFRTVVPSLASAFNQPASTPPSAATTPAAEVPNAAPRSSVLVDA
ncbi:Protein YOP1 [Mycena indigotica]|uniref:Protein YOP1 n=1 Tax=Mycena indigotica TaxID=2126181 RepID=A0A8H6W6K9_9AGAR|nr:Protein YOP1 [Mycena indigotica]KAF7306767.1 Protein YOP1 [Mycena indigotica]